MAPVMKTTFAGTGRYEIRRRLGSGGFGIVYQAFDHSRGQRVAIKTLAHLDPASLYRFKREFRTLADISHPNLIDLYELVSSDAEWFFTMELVNGIDFLSYVRGRDVSSFEFEADSISELSTSNDLGVTRSQSDFPTLDSVDPELVGDSTEPDMSTPADERTLVASFDEDRLRATLHQLAEGLIALHDKGIIHRDVKPSNVLVNAAGRVKLLDFGLVTELSEVGGRSILNVAGTPWYMAPELCRSEPPVPASDWYAVGVMLYEALTGGLPFAGSGFEVLVSKQQYRPRAPSAHNPDVPRDLEELCMDLLRRRAHLRPSGRDVLRRLGAGASLGRSGIHGVTGPLALTSASTNSSELVGRDGALADLEAAYEESRRGGAVTVYVDGSSGMGKTALVRQFVLGIAAREDAVVLAGRCYERESVPYKAFDSLVDSLSRYLVNLPPAEANSLVPRDVGPLCRVFPVLERVSSIAQAPRRIAEIPDPQQLRIRAFGALRELLARLADRRPLVLFVDDFQWGDADSVALMADLTRPPDAPDLLAIVCYRSEDAQTSGSLRALRDQFAPVGGLMRSTTITLGGLSHEESRTLARLLYDGHGPEVDRTVSAIAAEADGNPFLIYELARHAQYEMGRTGSSYAGGVSLEEMVRWRHEQLPSSARRLLEVVTVAGRPISQQLACSAAGLVAEEHAPALAALRVARFVRTSGSETGDSVEPYHNRIRETVRSFLDADVLRERQRGLGFALESSGRADPETLAMLFYAADIPERAARYAQIAAGQAESALAFDNAAQLYQLTLDLTDDPEDADRVRLKLADALVNAGRGAKAAAVFLDVAERRRGINAVDLRRRAAEQLLRSGHVDDGLAVMRAVLRKVGMRLPETPRRALASLLANRARLALSSNQVRETPVEEIVPALLSRIDICYAAALGLSTVDVVRAADFQTKHLLLALRAGEPMRMARALAMEASSRSTSGPRASSVGHYLEEAEALSHRLRSPHTSALVAIAKGIVAYQRGDWAESRALLDEADDGFRNRCIGAVWEADTAQRFNLMCLFYQGEYGEIARRVPLLLREAQERGDLYAMTNLRIGTNVVAWLVGGDSVGARRELDAAMRQWSRGGFHLQHYGELLGRTLVDLYEGEATEAWRRLHSSWPKLRRALLLRVERVHAEALYFRAMAAIGAANDPGVRSAALRDATRAASRLERFSGRWTPPLARLVKAGLCEHAGDDVSASQHLERAAVEFDVAGMRAFAAAARMWRGRFRGARMGTDANESRLTRLIIPSIRKTVER
jgi:eukaryotic-like serine/threonine-protein kinase